MSESSLMARLRSLPLLDGLPELDDLDGAQVAVVAVCLLAIAAGCVALGLSGVEFERDLLLRFGRTLSRIPTGMFWVGATLFVLGFSALVDSVLQASNWVRWPALAVISAGVVYATGWPPANPGQLLVGLGALWAIALFLGGLGPGSILVVAAWLLWYFGLFDLAVAHSVGLRTSAVPVAAMIRLMVALFTPFLLVAGLDVAEMLTQMADVTAARTDRHLALPAGLILAGAVLVLEWRLGVFASPLYLLAAAAWLAALGIGLLVGRVAAPEPAPRFGIALWSAYGFWAFYFPLFYLLRPPAPVLAFVIFGVASCAVGATTGFVAITTDAATPLGGAIRAVAFGSWASGASVLLMAALVAHLLGPPPLRAGAVAVNATAVGACVSAVALAALSLGAQFMTSLRRLRAALTRWTLFMLLAELVTLAAYGKFIRDLADVVAAVEVAFVGVAIALLLRTVSVPLRVLPGAVIAAGAAGCLGIVLSRHPARLEVAGTALLVALAVLWQVGTSGERLTGVAGRLWPQPARLFALLGFLCAGTSLAVFSNAGELSSVEALTQLYPVFGLTLLGAPAAAATLYGRLPRVVA